MRFLFSEGKTQGIPEKVWEDWIRQVDKNSDGGVIFIFEPNHINISPRLHWMNSRI